MTVLRSWDIKGTDGKTYTVNERELPGLVHNPVGGQRRVIPSGRVDYALADGRDLVDDTPGHWEVLANGVLLKHPADLEQH